MNLGCIYLFTLVFLFSLGKYTEVKLLDLMAVLSLPFLRNLHIVFHSGCANLQSHHWCIQFSSVTQSCPTLCDPIDSRLPCPSPTPGAYSKLMSIKSVMPSNHLILCHPLLLLSSVFSSIRVFSNESVLIRCPKYWSFSISPSSKYSGLISFRMDWLDHLAIKGTLKSLLQHHSSKASILQHSAFFII